jgi:protein-S-isoprenylcysteine O-methyltransferase Ste14
MTATLSKIIWLVGLVIFVLLRIGPRLRARKTPVRHSEKDARDLALVGSNVIGLGIVPLIYVATGFPQFANYPFMPAQGYAGTAVWIAALWLLYRTHRDLGHNWSMSLDVREQHTLVTAGVYTYVRHPMYSAFWLMGTAQLLLLPNWFAGFAGLIGFAVLFFGRVRREEEMMIGAFGDEYRAYMRRTARVIPWIY